MSMAKYTPLSGGWGIFNMGFDDEGNLVNLCPGNSYLARLIHGSLVYPGSKLPTGKLATAKLSTTQLSIDKPKLKDVKYSEEYCTENEGRFNYIKKKPRIFRNRRNKKKDKIKQNGYDDKYLPIFQYLEEEDIKKDEDEVDYYNELYKSKRINFSDEQSYESNSYHTDYYMSDDVDRDSYGYLSDGADWDYYSYL